MGQEVQAFAHGDLLARKGIKGVLRTLRKARDYLEAGIFSPILKLADGLFCNRNNGYLSLSFGGGTGIGFLGSPGGTKPAWSSLPGFGGFGNFGGTKALPSLFTFFFTMASSLRLIMLKLAKKTTPIMKVIIPAIFNLFVHIAGVFL